MSNGSISPSSSPHGPDAATPTDPITKRSGSSLSPPLPAKRARISTTTPAGTSRAARASHMPVYDPLFSYNEGHLAGVDENELTGRESEHEDYQDLVRSMDGDDGEPGSDIGDPYEELEMVMDEAASSSPATQPLEYLQLLLKSAMNANRDRGILRDELPPFDKSILPALRNAIFEAARHGSGDTFLSLLQKRDPVGALLYFEAHKVAARYACQVIQALDTKIDGQQNQISRLRALNDQKDTEIETLRTSLATQTEAAATASEKVQEMRDAFSEMIERMQGLMTDRVAEDEDEALEAQDEAPESPLGEAS